ncbi:histone-lysine N-methyltransferase ATX2-like isoform X1 [Ipomoea triloba]|uniref:histone-lysine N-methyltransferase ATX2-like isoform X1 n=1 Tax=Ipomoea triloba TaxID=35885 RepID=UPI00125CE765|nr:histone-lysine N-methyltransferase ATX2-like isoform X1 [Ipomoea triloba]
MALPSSDLTRTVWADEEARPSSPWRVRQRQLLEAEEESVDVERGTPLKYVSLCDVYSATSPCVRASGSKKVKASRKITTFDIPNCAAKQFVPAAPTNSSTMSKPPITQFYTRRCKRKQPEPSFFNSLTSPLQPIVAKLDNVEVKTEVEEGTEDEIVAKDENYDSKKRRKVGSSLELLKLGVDVNSISSGLNGLRETRNKTTICSNNTVTSDNNKTNCKTNSSLKANNVRKQKEDGALEINFQSGQIRCKKWVWLRFEGVDPKKFVGLQCKVYWPLDADWYKGRILGYNFDTGRHHVKYTDGDEEHLILSNERVKFFVSAEEIKHLKLSRTDGSAETDGIDVNEMVVLAASLDDCEQLEPGDIIWAKLTGHAMWPAIVLDESQTGGRKGLKKTSGEKSVLVQFFGTHDFARIKVKQVISFLRGLLSSFHLKCRKPNFVRGLEEAKMYLSEQKLPKRMLRLRNGVEADDYDSEKEGDDCHADSDGESMENGLQRRLEDLRRFPFELGDLQIISLGKIVDDSDNFQDDKCIWPEGYTALRKSPSIMDPNKCASYKMEVLRDPDLRTRPMFRITSDNGEQFKGSTPSACWNKIMKKIRKLQANDSGGTCKGFLDSGSDMFGFSHPEILKLIKELSKSRAASKYSKLSSKCQELPAGYRPVRVKWKDLDKCNVCHMDEEYVNNLFLQCDKCRMMVHARCYGELEPVDGVLWLCNLCRLGAPEFPPPCCLCPVIGGAMKPTTDGRWAHLACAIWIPETCLSDIKKMEPIDGLNRVNKDRWKLLCSICGVPYGACIQCSNNNCCVAYHPLCARAAGFCVELEDEDRLHLIPLDEDEEDQCIRLISFCKKHRPLSNERPAVDECVAQKVCEYSDYIPPPNPSGCARSEPYNHFGRRGRKEPEALAAASLKRLYVENRPYLVGGHSQHDSFCSTVSSNAPGCSKYSVDLQKLKNSHLHVSKSIQSMSEKYEHMKGTFRKRLAFGKSGIHGFGIFAKHQHKAGDMVIEYSGELVRPPIADRREHLIYNSLVGAGTYMFRIDDERVIDATRAGSIAHLINHSCEPNCYSRVITANGDEHIIIFAKRDIKQWEELTYDYRFFSIDEQLSCYCGFPRCRGVVNDTEAEERMAKQLVPQCELIDWTAE